MKHRGVDYSQALIWMAATVGMIRYSAAFLASDVGQIIGPVSEWITFLLGVSGFAMGLLSTFGTAYLFDGWRRKMPAQGATWPFKFRVLTLFVFAAFFFELLILVPFTVSRMNHVSMTDILQGGVWWWSISVNIMPLLLIGGATVGNQIVNISEHKDPESHTKDDAKVSRNFPNDWRKVLPFLSDAELLSMSKMKTVDLITHYNLNNPKTAQNWRKYAQDEIARRSVNSGVG